MAILYANENIRKNLVIELRKLGHEVITAYEVGNANQSIPDSKVLEYAIEKKISVITCNRMDFVKLHKSNPNHFGIIVCTEDKDTTSLAFRIHLEIMKLNDNLTNQLIKVNRPNKF